MISSQISSTERASCIPLERFARVARLWPNKRGSTAGHEATNIWAEVVEYKGDNILTDTSIARSSPVPSIGKENESKWGLDEDKRQELIHELGSDLLSLNGSNNSPDFPPTRLLNLGLDLVFRQPNSLLPFIHQPTFSAKSTPNLVVLSLCLLGLALLDSKQVKALAFSYLPVRRLVYLTPFISQMVITLRESSSQGATEKCCHQLATPCFGPGSSATLISRLTSATLLLTAWRICLARVLFSLTLPLFRRS